MQKKITDNLQKTITESPINNVKDDHLHYQTESCEIGNIKRYLFILIKHFLSYKNNKNCQRCTMTQLLYSTRGNIKWYHQTSLQLRRNCKCENA